MLVLTRKAEESITIGNHITVSVLEIRGNQVKLGIKAPKDIPINRTEIYERILLENILASKAPQDLERFPEVLKLKDNK
ncbi:MAG: carbon storage regulator CsrA [Deltaproteobacteria bacterium]|nr:carbon storage regulator CsrA [Deltaproteobacteria bacterium]